jgi:uncharacterized protein YcbK (DUF882 family)
MTRIRKPFISSDRHGSSIPGRVLLAALFGLLLAAPTAAPVAKTTGPAPVSTPEPERSLSFYNTHTGEHLSLVYRRGDEYLPNALERINHLLRDYRCGQEHAIDPELLDFLYDLLRKVHYQGEVFIISGYRAPVTNRAMHERSSGVVLGSQHTFGRAIDIRLPGKDTHRLYEIARSMKRGGTGYYGRSDFIHIDTGRVRCW